MLSIPIHFTQNLYTPLPPRLGGFTSSPTPPILVISNGHQVIDHIIIVRRLWPKVFIVVSVILFKVLTWQYWHSHGYMWILSKPNYSVIILENIWAITFIIILISPPPFLVVRMGNIIYVPLLMIFLSLCANYQPPQCVELFFYNNPSIRVLFNIILKKHITFDVAS